MERKKTYTQAYKRKLLRDFLKKLSDRNIKQGEFADIIGYTGTWLSAMKRGRTDVPDVLAWGIEQNEGNHE